MAHTVLITGANGFIGSHTTLLMESLGHRVVAVDAAPRSTDLSLLGIRTPSHIMDVTDAAAFRELSPRKADAYLSRRSPASETKIPPCSTLLPCHDQHPEAAKALKMRRVVYSSSASIYGQLKNPTIVWSKKKTRSRFIRPTSTARRKPCRNGWAIFIRRSTA
jgi:nucleoside-diphosphate-sugar epimerase